MTEATDTFLAKLPALGIPHDTYASCRRRYLDAFLSATPWQGRVLDVGGKKTNKRGTFRPPLASVECWNYVNTEAATEPDYLASAEQMPIQDCSYDMVLLSEVLEHLGEPEKALAEASRVLRPGGALVCAAPFLYPLHADPEDYQRWLPARYKKVLGALGFRGITVIPMGGFFAVSYDLLQLASRAWLRTAAGGWKRTAMQHAVPGVLHILFKLDQRHRTFLCPHFTTGYYVFARKI